jgi:hypothetical protein
MPNIEEGKFIPKFIGEPCKSSNFSKKFTAENA